MRVCVCVFVCVCVCVCDTLHLSNFSRPIVAEVDGVVFVLDKILSQKL